MADSLQNAYVSVDELAPARTCDAAVARTALPVLATAATAAYLWLFLKSVWRIGDEGSIVYGAQRVAEGAVPYRDFFEVMGPGSFYWLALWFEALGTSWLTSRLAVLTTALVSGWAIYYITSRKYPGRFAIVPAAFYTLVTIPLWPGANHHFDSNMWVLLALAVVLSVPEVSAKRGLIAGVLLGVSSTIMPQKGVLIVAALALSAVIQSWRTPRWRRALVSVMSMVSGLGAVGLLVVLLFWSQGALGELVYATAIWPMTQYHSVNVVPYAHGMTELLPSWSSVLRSVLPVTVAAAASAAVMIPLAFIASLPLLAAGTLAWQAIYARRRYGTAQNVPWAYGLTGLALFASECHRPDLMHLIYGSPVLLVVVTGSLAASRAVTALIARRVLAGSLVALTALLAVIASNADAKVATRRGQVSMFQADEALAFLRENVAAGEAAFVYPYYPMYYFLADLRNPTRYSILMYHINTRAQFEEVVSALETERVRYVLWDTRVAGENLTHWFPMYTHPPQDEQIVERYLDANYREIAVRNGFRVLERVDTAER